MNRPAIPELDTPALVIDVEAMERNLRRMAEWFAGRACTLRPHAKTHKCTEVARRQVKLGAMGITCAKLGEAEAMAAGGIEDILIANQVVGATKLKRLAALARRAMLTVAIDNLANASEIAQAVRRVGAAVGVLLEVDTGMGRCGIPPDRVTVVRHAQELSRMPGLRFRGLMGYEGHAVLVDDPAERRAKAEAAGRTLLDCAAAVRGAGIEVEVVSGGGTGTYDFTGALDGFTEIQAGSYVFMDARYRRVRPEFETALFVAATVVSRPTPDRVILDAGMKSVSHEFGLPIVVEPQGLQVVGLSEEHVKCVAAAGTCDLSVGDQVWLLPTHCCTTVNLHDRYWCVRDGKLEGTWAIEARGKSA
ncbi:MAG TPA: DSD1 family PLP-dependent enzyme [Planctomycetota bacterium]|nr:DSD1 family PLP-dependent enzyme [Planctomycetota bacterium]